VVYAEQARQQTRAAGVMTIEGQPQAGLKPWREIVTPHPDVAAGRFIQAEFAADLSQVYRARVPMSTATRGSFSPAPSLPAA